METGLRPLGREKFWLFALLLPTCIGLLFGALGSILDADTEEKAREMIDRIVDPVGTFYRFTMASSNLKGSK